MESYLQPLIHQCSHYLKIQVQVQVRLKLSLIHISIIIIKDIDTKIEIMCKNLIIKLPKNIDLLITTGGVSVGKKDIMPVSYTHLRL